MKRPKSIFNSFKKNLTGGRGWRQGGGSQRAHTNEGVGEGAGGGGEESLYQEDLPTHFVTNYHFRKVEQHVTIISPWFLNYLKVNILIN